MFLEADQIIVADNLHVRRQLQLITSSRSTILSSDREVNIFPFIAGLAGARRVDPLKIIQSPASLTKQVSRRAYRRKRYARLKSFFI